MPAFSADITHDFTSGTGRTFGPNNKSCTITQSSGTFTYTCGDDAVFGLKSGKIYLLMNNSGDSVTLSPAITDLSEIRIAYSPFTTDNYHLLVYVSEDGSSWGNPLPASRFSNLGAGFAMIIVPKGTSYVKIENSDGTDLAISQIIYTPVDCNCNTYIPE
jgi:hypothetical protein